MPRTLFYLSKVRFLNSYNIVRVFYILVFYEVVRLLGLWTKWLDTEGITPLWPLYWINLTALENVVNIIFTISLVATFLCLLLPHKRLLRIFVFISLLEFLSFLNSFGKVGHSFHVLLYFSFMLIFLPNEKKDEIENSIYKRQIYLNTIFASQILFMLTYTLSGLWKVLYALEQFFEGEIHAFSHNALALLVSNRLMQTNSHSILGNYFIEYPLMGWPIYVGAIYLELLSIVAVFRPSIHRLWGILLIVFHVSTYLTMTINFPRNILILALFFVFSPFNLNKDNYKKIFLSMPLIDVSNVIFKFIYKKMKNCKGSLIEYLSLV